METDDLDPIHLVLSTRDNSPPRDRPLPPPSRQLYGALYEVTSCDTFPATSLSAELKHAGSKHSFSLLVLGR